VALSRDELQALTQLADAWMAADDARRTAMRAEAATRGASFERAFAAMVEQLMNEGRATPGGATLLPPISESLREVAIQGAFSSTANAEPNDTALASANVSNLSNLAGTISAPAPRESGQHVGPYRLIKELGRGGMGVVWLAERADGTHARQVALKMPLVENLNWLLAARFARERNILASLEHPSIARLYDAGVDDKTQPYIAIEYVLGVPITDYVKEKKLKPEATAQLFIRVIEAVAHAHTQLVIHRDIKPSNILVDAKGEPHLLDFGIAKLLDDEDSQGVDTTQLTRLSGRALTLDYASPEQVNNATLGTASDVYSLGIVLYELLTGSRPYRPKGPTRRDLEQAILDQDPSKPSDHLLTSNTGDSESGKSARRMRGDLDTVVLKALRKDPKQRYATAQAFADDLKRYLAFEPIAAKPDAGWYRVGRFVRRNRWVLAASAVIAATVTGGVVSTLWQAQQAEMERQKATTSRDAALQELTHSEVMSEFMSYLLTGAAAGDTAADLLYKAQAQAERQFANDPNVGVRLQLNIADMLHSRSDYERAAKVLALATKSRHRVTDNAIVARLDCQSATSEARVTGGADSLAKLDRVIAAVQSSSGDSAEFTHCLLERAIERRNRGDAAGSTADAEAALVVLDQRAGLRPTAVLMRAIIADNKQLLGELREAIAMYERAFADLVALGRGQSQDGRVVMTDMALAYAKAGQTYRAFQIYENIVRITPAGIAPSFGPLMVNYAKNMADVGKIDNAQRLFDVAIRDAKASNVKRAIGFTSMGAALTACAAADANRCEALTNNALDALTDGLPAKHSAFGTMKLLRGHVAWLRGEMELARSAWSDASDHFAGASDTKIAQIRALSWLARAEAGLGKNAEANSHADAAVALARASLNGFQTSEWLGGALLAQAVARKAIGNEAQASSALTEAINNLRQAVGQDSVLLKEALVLSKPS
jgi:eukaryotic-like serine/threonine-protein kinase